MTKNIEEIINQLSEQRRQEIEMRYLELVSEQMSLQDIRKARKLTQKRIAETLNIGQDSVSRLEQRSDLLLSTLKNYINSMGGNLKLVVEFPDRSPVIIEGLAELDDLTEETLDTESASPNYTTQR